MQMIILCGIQASGKTTFYLQHFFRTHIRISLDQLNTRNKEAEFIKTCLKLQQRFVVDNTNPTRAERAGYIQKARAKKFRVIGYYFRSTPDEALSRNSKRSGKENIPIAGLLGTYKKLEKPTLDEGFDELYEVVIKEGSFRIREMEVL